MFYNAYRMTKKASKNSYTNWKTVTVDAVDLSLDAKNIRLELTHASQDEIINDLFVNENAFQIVKSIVENGFFPDELPIVIKENKATVVIEGNRRVAALKTLINPDAAPSHAKKIKKLIQDKKVSPTKSINVVQAPDRERVFRLLAQKHTVTTRRPWKPLRKAYFYYAQYKAGKSISDLRTAYPGTDIENYVKMWEMHDIAKSMTYTSLDVEKKVHSQKTFPISTLERLYDDQFFRKHLGLEFDKDGQVKINANRKQFEKVFTKVNTDLVNKVIDSRKLNTSKGIASYLKGVPPVTSKAGGKTMGVVNFHPKKIQGIKPKKIVPIHLVCNMPNPGVIKMFDELRDLNYVKFPNAAADLLRSLLECSIKAHYANKGLSIKKGNKKARHVFLHDALKQLAGDAQIPARVQQVARHITSRGHLLFSHVDFLNAINHNPDLFASSAEVKDAWDKVESILKELYK